LQCCGLFDSQEDACRFGARVREYLRSRRWSPLFGALPPDERHELAHMPDFLSRVMGIDPAFVLVTVREYGSASDSAPLGETVEHWRLDAGHIPEESDEDDGDDCEDTPLVLTDVRYTAERDTI
jgi:hypothetical protein